MTVQGKPKTVGFIGIGDQGLPMALALAENGFKLHVWARRASAYEELGTTPHITHDTPKLLAEACDVVCLCVRTDDDVFQLLHGGMLDGMRPGTILVNHGTGTPKNAERIAALCAQGGINCLDAPVSGARQGAVSRTLTTLVGGPRASFERCEPLFNCFSRHVVFLGDAGAGQAAKLFNNTLMILNQTAATEVLNLARDYGLDQWKLIGALKLCSGFSNSLIHFNSVLTMETAPHMSEVEVEDMIMFEAAMAEAGIDVKDLTERAVAGARKLPDLIRQLNS